MARVRGSFGLALIGGLLASAAAHADDPVGATSIITRPAPAVPAPAAPAPLVGLDSGALALVPPGSAAAARSDGLAGSSSTGIDLSYIPPADRDSYLNSRDFADHLQTSVKGGHHPSALSQLGGAAEGMAINGLLGEGTSLVLGGH